MNSLVNSFYKSLFFFSIIILSSFYQLVSQEGNKALSKPGWDLDLGKSKMFLIGSGGVITLGSIMAYRSKEHNISVIENMKKISREVNPRYDNGELFNFSFCRWRSKGTSAKVVSSDNKTIFPYSYDVAKYSKDLLDCMYLDLMHDDKIYIILVNANGQKYISPIQRDANNKNMPTLSTMKLIKTAVKEEIRKLIFYKYDILSNIYSEKDIRNGLLDNKLYSYIKVADVSGMQALESIDLKDIKKYLADIILDDKLDNLDSDNDDVDTIDIDNNDNTDSSNVNNNNNNNNGDSYLSTEYNSKSVLKRAFNIVKRSYKHIDYAFRKVSTVPNIISRFFNSFVKYDEYIHSIIDAYVNVVVAQSRLMAIKDIVECEIERRMRDGDKPKDIKIKGFDDIIVEVKSMFDNPASVTATNLGAMLQRANSVHSELQNYQYWKSNVSEKNDLLLDTRTILDSLTSKIGNANNMMGGGVSDGHTRALINKLYTKLENIRQNKLNPAPAG